MGEGQGGGDQMIVMFVSERCTRDPGKGSEGFSLHPLIPRNLQHFGSRMISGIDFAIMRSKKS